MGANTLEAQREAAEAYILSQRHVGWTVVAERYDDGGYTGGNLESSGPAETDYGYGKRTCPEQGSVPLLIGLPGVK